MILTKEQILNETSFVADICIVGGGPTAISMALAFRDSPLRVIIIAGGGWTETSSNQDLNIGIISPPGSHEPLEESRRRQFGGTSAVWGKRCVPFDPIDFKARPWVSESGWPLSYNDLLPYYEKAAEICKIGSCNFDVSQVFLGKQQEIIEGLDSNYIASNPLERSSPIKNFAKAYKGELENNSNIKVLLDAHVLSLEMLEGSEKVTNVMAAVDSSRLTVRASHFVLATGGIENARLLLVSANKYFPKGLGNQHDNVGRHYMCHISGTFAKINFFDRSNAIFDYEKDHSGIFCRRRWWISEEAQKTFGLLNTIFFLDGHMDVLYSAGFVYKSILTILSQKTLAKVISKGKLYSPLIKHHLLNFFKKVPFHMIDFVYRGLKRMSKNRTPSSLPSIKSKYWGLFFQAEHIANKESRICLSETDRDAFGMPRAEVKISFKDIDIESIIKAHNIFINAIRAKNLGEVVYSEDGLRSFLKNRISSFYSAAHHIGTTRMSDNARTGVVDKNAKVFEISNLFVAGSSTFPTSSHANPMFTQIAQALRLVDHLRSIVEETEPLITSNVGKNFIS
jgi:choline dehydrogenase-like flavoprotein